MFEPSRKKVHRGHLTCDENQITPSSSYLIVIVVFHVRETVCCTLRQLVRHTTN